MDTERRKRHAPSGDNGRRARARGEEAAKAASEEDVEEFFAILRRMHAAARHLGDGKGGDGRELMEGWRSWRPAFEWEDFVGVKGGGEEKGPKSDSAAAEGEKKVMREDKGATRELDLNAEPEPENANAAVHSVSR